MTPSKPSTTSAAQSTTGNGVAYVTPADLTAEQLREVAEAALDTLAFPPAEKPDPAKPHVYVDKNDDGKCDVCGMAEDADLHDAAPGAAATADAPRFEVVDPASLADAPALTDPLVVNVDGGVPFRALLLTEGTETDDGRKIAEGAVSWRELPLTLMAMISEGGGGHTGSVVSGRIDEITKDGLDVVATGRFDTGEYGAEIARLVADRTLRGISVDLAVKAYEEQPPVDSPDGEGDPMDAAPLMVVTDGVIMGATVCPFPAFANAGIETVTAAALRHVDYDEADRVARLEAIGFFQLVEDLPAPEPREYSIALTREDDDVAHLLRVRGDYQTISETLAAEMLLQEPIPHTTGATTRLYVRLADALTDAGCELVDEAHDDKPYTTLATIRDGEIEETFRFSAALTASAAGLAPDKPPLDWFADPQLSEPTPFTITPEGRVYGHVAYWDSCHTGHGASVGSRGCLPPPRNTSGYAYFHKGQLETAEGDLVNVGVVTMGTGHASTDYRVSPKAAAAHYDHTGTQAEYVRLYDDAYGIAAAGCVNPDLSASDLRCLRAADVSGDWRSIQGRPELVAVLAVNVPGFAKPRPKQTIHRAEDGTVRLALVAAGIEHHAAPCDCVEDFDAQLDALLASALPGVAVTTSETSAGVSYEAQLDALVAAAAEPDPLAALIQRGRP